MKSSESEIPAPPVSDETWAVCCSGGGIRTAVYCLGALQVLEETRFLDKTRLIVGVSGGSYMAASRALVARGLEPSGDVPGSAYPAGLPAYAPGSPEEQHLRAPTRDLAPDDTIGLAGALALLFGVAVTLVLVLAPVFAVAHVWGWVLRAQGVLARSGVPRPAQWTVSLAATSWWIWPVTAAVVTVVVFMWWRATLTPDPRGQQGHSQLARWTLNWSAFITLALATAMLAIPALLSWLSGPHSGALKTVLNNLGFGSGAAWTPAALTGFVVALVAVSQSAEKYVAKCNVPSARSDAQAKNAPPGFPGTVTGYLRGTLLPWIASILALLAGLIAALRWVQDGAVEEVTGGPVWQVIGALVVILVMRFLADINRISLHDFYRWHLASTYSVTRDTGRHGGSLAPFATRDFPGALLSELSGQQPQLVLCMTATINAGRQALRRGALSFSFDPRHATLRGPDPAESVKAHTTDYEALIGRRRCTLFDLAAISGLAFPPLTGSLTLRAFRVLFALTGLRLGVWLPHPAVVAAAHQELDRQMRTDARPDQWWHAVWLLLWYLLPHPPWQQQGEKSGGREARLWAYVLKLRRNNTRFQQFLGGLLYRALQPTLGILCAEAAGRTSYRGTWMCVTDGGHYDNLGLVEALHRAPEFGITNLLVLDASGDRADTWSTLGRAIALAGADARSPIELDPTAMVRGGRDLAPGQLVRPWAHGRFLRPQASQSGDIWVCKLGWWTGAPWDVVAYAKQNPSYPSSNPAEQLLYDVTEFDAYRQLGSATVREVAKHWAANLDRRSEPESGRAIITGAP
jgi:hypothetical protein